MKSNGWLASAAYLLAAYLIVVPLAETALAVSPPGPGDPSWRFGALGLLSQALMTPLVGLVLAVGVALAHRHRAALVLTAALGVAAALAVVVELPTFLGDGARLRGVLEVADRTDSLLVVLAGGLKMVFALLISCAVAWGGWTAARSLRGARTGAKVLVTPRRRSRATRSPAAEATGDA